MQPQDVYNRAYDTATRALEQWTQTIKDVAVVDSEQTASYWRVRLRPLEINACPAELMISRDQSFDIDIGTESLVNQSVTDLSLFLPLLQAVADGHVICRIWSAQATGIELTREIVVQPADRSDWSMKRIISAGTAATEMSAVACDRAYVAYRRG